MTKQRDFEHLLREWTDVGDERLPDRYLRAALHQIESTRQRGAWSAPWEGLIMRLQPAASILAVATVVILAIGAYLAFSGNNIGGPPTLTPEPSRTITAADLATIVLADTEAPEGMRHDDTVNGVPALIRPFNGVTDEDSAAALTQAGFVEGRYAEFSGDPGALLSWAALFETVEDAERSLALYETEIEADKGYGLGAGTDADIGDEGAYFEGDSVLNAGGTGPVGPTVHTRVYLWRIGPLVLAAGSHGDFSADDLRAVAEEMDARAH